MSPLWPQLLGVAGADRFRRPPITKTQGGAHTAQTDVSDQWGPPLIRLLQAIKHRGAPNNASDEAVHPITRPPFKRDRGSAAIYNYGAAMDEKEYQQVGRRRPSSGLRPGKEKQCRRPRRMRRGKWISPARSPFGAAAWGDTERQP